MFLIVPLYLLLVTHCFTNQMLWGASVNSLPHTHTRLPSLLSLKGTQPSPSSTSWPKLARLLSATPLFVFQFAFGVSDHVSFQSNVEGCYRNRLKKEKTCWIWIQPCDMAVLVLASGCPFPKAYLCSISWCGQTVAPKMRNNSCLLASEFTSRKPLKVSTNQKSFGRSLN